MTKVMIVEDNKTMVNLLSTILNMEGYEVIIIDSPYQKEIVAAVMSGAPDILLLDVNLQHSNGIDILKEIRQNSAVNKSLKVIMTSGMDLEIECKKAGADSFLTKPYMPDELLAVMKKS